MEVKPGYKHTEVGVIPQEWEVKELGEVVACAQGVQVDLDKQIRNQKEGFVRFLRIENYTQQSDDYRFVPTQALRNRLIIEDDVVVVRYGATAGFIGRGLSGILANNLFSVEPKPSKLTKEFLFICLNSNAAFKYFQTSMYGGAMPALSFKVVKVFQIPLPPLPEQCAIATALSDVDGLLGGLDRLIAKKRDLKQAAMQQLLTGQTRLPSFQGEWEVTTLGELCDYVDGITTSGGDLGYLEIGDVNVETKSYDVAQKEKLSVRGAVKVPAGTLLISTVRPTRGAIVITKSSLHVSSAFCRVRPANGLLFHLVCQTKFLAYLGENSFGGTYPTCRDETILGYESPLPNDPTEQTAIAEVLTEMDAELAALEQRRDKTRALKQAMMQELLTGRTRLVSSDAGAKTEVRR